VYLSTTLCPAAWAHKRVLPWLYIRLLYRVIAYKLSYHTYKVYVHPSVEHDSAVWPPSTHRDTSVMLLMDTACQRRRFARNTMRKSSTLNPLRSFVPYRGTYGKFRFSPMSRETGHTIMLSSCGLESPWAGHYVAVVVYGNFRASTTGFTVSLFTFVCLLFSLLCDRLWHQLVNVIKLLK